MPPYGTRRRPLQHRHRSVTLTQREVSFELDGQYREVGNLETQIPTTGWGGHEGPSATETSVLEQARLSRPVEPEDTRRPRGRGQRPALRVAVKAHHSRSQSARRGPNRHPHDIECLAESNPSRDGDGRQRLGHPLTLQCGGAGFRTIRTNEPRLSRHSVSFSSQGATDPNDWIFPRSGLKSTMERPELRSVLVWPLPPRLSASELGEFFQAQLGQGTVNDVRLVTARASGRSRGIAYVELTSVDAVPRAIALSGALLLGCPIEVQLTGTDETKGDSHNTSEYRPQKSTRAPSTEMRRLHIGSLHFKLTESELSHVFCVFGELVSVDLPRDSVTGQSRGFAFIQYKRYEDAQLALKVMNGFELAGRQLRVSMAHGKGGSPGPPERQKDTLSDDEEGGTLNAASRQALMRKLARNDTPETPGSRLAGDSEEEQAVSSRSLLLRNMFGGAAREQAANGPLWAEEISLEVKEECEDKYGAVQLIHLDTCSQ
ncbi:hypothetical protein CALCODRAFT_461961, partial [Calocera cornea HHB12733]